MPIGQENRGQWMQWRLEGWSYGKIAAQAGVTRQRVQQVLAPPKEIRNFVAKRAAYHCQMCNVQLGISGHVHHANGEASTIEDYEDIEKLVYLCMPCHRSVHGNPGGQAKSTMMLQLRVPPQLYQDLAEIVQDRIAQKKKASLNSVAIEGLESWIKDIYTST